MGSEDKPRGYNDIYFRVIIALIAAHLIVTFGAKESIFLLLISWYYYRDLLLSFLIAFLIVNEVYLVVLQLDKRFDWKRYPAERIGLQLVFGLIFPAITAFLLATGYFAIFGIRILDTLYLKFDFPVIVIMIILLNVYYLAFYFFRQWQWAERKVSEPKMSLESEQKSKEVFIVQKGAKIIPLPVENISYFYHEGDYNFVRTNSKEDFLISQPLDEVQQKLQEKQFFRANRQMIVNFTACEHFEPLAFGKLELKVTPPLKEPIIISQKKARQFKEWIER